MSEIKPLLVGLTGSIGMGKSTAAEMFAALGFSVFDADETVHKLYGKGGAAVDKVTEIFPAARRDDAVDRAVLAGLLGDDHGAFEKLEAIVHPMVAEAREAFAAAAAARGETVVLLNIPLLFETGDAEKMDAVIVVSAPESVQRTRVLSRPGMTLERLNHILARQKPDAEKRRAADYVIDTGEGYERTFAQIVKVAETLRRRAKDK